MNDGEGILIIKVIVKNALNKYGKENFKMELICVCFDEKLNKYEIDYINKYNSLVII